MTCHLRIWSRRNSSNRRAARVERDGRSARPADRQGARQGARRLKIGARRAERRGGRERALSLGRAREHGALAPAAGRVGRGRGVEEERTAANGMNGIERNVVERRWRFGADVESKRNERTAANGMNGIDSNVE